MAERGPVNGASPTRRPVLLLTGRGVGVCMAQIGFGFYAGVPEWARPYTGDAWQLLHDPGDANPFGHNNVIGRPATPGDAWEMEFVRRGAEGGAAFGAACLAAWNKAPWITYWLGPNEPAANTAEDAAHLSAFYQGFAAFAHARGRKIMGGNFSRGRPDENTLAGYVGMAQACDGLAFHEYGFPDLSTPDDFGWHAFRYRRLTDILRARGIQRDVWITELGVDMQRGHAGGWRSVGLSAAEYLAQLRWYALEAARDSFVRGLVLYAASAYGWQSFLIDPEIAAGCQAINRSLPVSSPPTPAPAVAGPTAHAMPQPAFGLLGWPVRDERGPVGIITQGFGARPEYYRQFRQPDGQPYAGHNGIDIAVVGYSAANAPYICSPIPGEVWAYADPNGYGNAVEVWYPSRSAPVYKMLFGHLLDKSVRVKTGQMVEVGAVLGRMGWSGNCQPAGVRGAHLHVGGKPLRHKAINPGFNGWTDLGFYLVRV